MGIDDLAGVTLVTDHIDAACLTDTVVVVSDVRKGGGRLKVQRVDSVERIVGVSPGFRDRRAIGVPLGIAPVSPAAQVAGGVVAVERRSPVGADFPEQIVEIVVFV